MSSTAQERARSCGSFGRLSLENKKSLVAAYQTADVVQDKLRALSKSATFRFVFDGANFGTKLHPKAELAARQSGHSAEFVATELANQVSTFQGYLLSWLADITHQQILLPLISAFEGFCLDEMNVEGLLSVVTGFGFAHAHPDDDTQSHWKVQDGTLWWIANTHCTAFVTGHNVFPAPQVRGYYTEVFTAVCNLLSPPAQPVLWDARLNVISAACTAPAAASSSSEAAAVAPAAEAAGLPPLARAKAAASYTKISLEQKKLLVTCFETSEAVQRSLREISKNPSFRFVLNADHFGAKAQQALISTLAQRGYNPADHANQIAEWQTWFLSWLSDAQREQLIAPMVRAFEQFCLDDMNRECLFEVISGVGFMHGPETEDLASHFLLQDGVLYWVAMTHTTQSFEGHNIYPSGSWVESFKAIADLGSPQSAPIKWDSWMTRI